MTRQGDTPFTDPVSVEAALEDAYIASLPAAQRPIVRDVSPEDEMYIYLRNNLPDKDTALALYMHGGLEAVRVIDNVLEQFGKRLSGLRSFLDFACGYGKSTRFLVRRLDASRVWVSDIYTGAVDFQRERFGVQGFYSAPRPEDVPFGRTFEAIYVGSLFSHLPADTFRAWLAALYSVLDDDGVLIVSTHGERVQPLDEATRDVGFRFVAESESRSLDKRQYGSSTVTEPWVRRLAGQLGMADVHFLPAELWAQDIFVFAKRRSPTTDRLLSNPFPLGNLEGALLTGPRRLRVSGWAIERRRPSPIRRVRIQLGDVVLGEATVGIPRPDVAQHFGRDELEASGWVFEGDIPKAVRQVPPVVTVLLDGTDGSSTTGLVGEVRRGGAVGD